jgi:hypothetical protein
MKENLKIALDIVQGTILEVSNLIELYEKNDLTDEMLNKKINIIKNSYLVNVLIYILSE